MQDSGLLLFNTYIIELLYRHDKLVVPGLGAFICTEAPSGIHPVTHEIRPPSKEISFDSRQQDDDGVLLTYLVKNLPARKEAARRILNEKVNAFREALKTEAQTLPGLGTFRLLAHGDLEFTPDPSANFLASSFGLRMVRANPVLRNASPSSEAVSEVPEKPAEIPVIQSAAAPGPPMAEVKPPQAPNNKKRNYSLAIFLLPLLAFTALGILYHRDAELTVRMIVSGWQAKQTDSTPAAITPGTTINEASMPAPTPVDTIIESNLAPDTVQRYFIVAGCFKSEHNANNLVRELQGKGYNASIQGRNTQGLLQVCYQGFADTLSANTFLQNIKANENRDAWRLDFQSESK
jgi:hypothetical protein